MSHFSHIKFDASEAEIEAALASIISLNNNLALVFCPKEYGYTNGAMKANYRGYPNRGTFSDYQHERDAW